MPWYLKNDPIQLGMGFRLLSQPNWLEFYLVPLMWNASRDAIFLALREGEFVPLSLSL